MYNRIIYTILFVFACTLSLSAQNQDFTLKGIVQDAQTKEPLSFATIQLKKSDNSWFGVSSDHNGRYSFSKLPAGTYTATVSYLGYDTKNISFTLSQNKNLTINLSYSSISLNEVVVTASESKGLTSASKINRTAMEHLQPTSFSDLLELLPGGKSIDPDMGNANLINIREAGSSSEGISSQGVEFMIDDMPVNTNANLQYVPGTTQGSDKESVSMGVDMRTISTDNIESVEIVRGIPSVEYGNLTGGLVHIKRKSNASPLTARFKADQVSKLFSVGKGWSLGGNHILNTDISYLDSKVDPRDSRENYKRLTTSIRWTSNKQTNLGHHDWYVNADYTGSFDDVKRDKDITVKEDSYKSSYNKFAIGMGWTLKRSADSFLRELNAKASVSQELSKIKEQKSVSIDRPTATPSSTETGEADGEYLPYTYIGNMTVDGKPFYANAKLMGKFHADWWKTKHDLKVGIEWNLSKNFGDGRVYDMTRPLNTTGTTRPRSYKSIPAQQIMSFYAEEEMKLPLGKHQIILSAGVRTTSLLGLDKEYAMKGKLYADPRLNIKWQLPNFGSNKDWLLDFSAGLGWLSMMPSIAQLYPDDKYVDIVQLNYYHTNADYRRINLMTYKWSNVNYDLKPARNRKWEIRATLSHKGNNLSVTYFKERMNNGFTDISYYKIFPYKSYDATSIDSGTLTGPPALEDMTYENDTLIDTYSTTGNGMRVRKQGVEFTFASKRIQSLSTRFTINGAWIKTTYSNSMPQYKSSSILLNGKQLNYIGLYEWESGTTREQFNTNFMADTYLKRIGMTFSLAAQCTWFTASQPLWNSGMPVSYVDKSGTTHTFTEADAENTQLQHLVQTYASSYFDRTTVPFAMDINLKATKEIGRYLQLSLFVNRILTVYPSYHRGTQLVRRSASPYFGMEANLKF